MTFLETKNGNYLVAGGKNKGVKRFAYFNPAGKFIHYAPPEKWEEALREWGVSPANDKEERFIFPSMYKWNIQDIGQSQAGKVVFFWRWRPNPRRHIQMTRVVINGKIVFFQDDCGLSLTNDMLGKINFVRKWNKEGLHLFDYEKVFDLAAVNDSLHMPMVLINSCSLLSWDEKIVAAATEFIGVQKPYYCHLEWAFANNRKQAILVSLKKGNSNAEFKLMTDGTTLPGFGGTLQRIKSVGDEKIIFSCLLWIFLNQLPRLLQP